ncbi:hypothetical protein ANANG_G00261230 [Anguilla anguilla]|uniref:Uncharacterized protein n=1 Tax=Anguilla anguilla TaxID=7936 RepID=A0A9D3LQD0_ANGAN|nr:hypothetical protein ANANG_G00261230 [Anguilla anguilla]
MFRGGKKEEINGGEHLRAASPELRFHDAPPERRMTSIFTSATLLPPADKFPISSYKRGKHLSFYQRPAMCETVPISVPVWPCTPPLRRSPCSSACLLFAGDETFWRARPVLILCLAR